MLAKFRALPLSVKIAIFFLIFIISLGVMTAPQIAIPFLIIIGTVASLIRVMVYLLHDV